MKLLNHILNYIYPPRCISCSELVQETGGFCGACWAKLNFITSPYCRVCSLEFPFDPGGGNDICLKCLSTPPSYDLARTVLRFDEHSKKLIHNFKYYDSTFIASDFAKIIAKMHQKILSKADYVIPVPMHKWKRLFRFYNQAQVLASEISKELNIKMLPDILLKTRYGKSQTGLSKKQREENLRGTIAVDKQKKLLLKEKIVILVDDVMTTGSTVNLCASKLKRAGAKEVIVICLARTLL